MTDMIDSHRQTAGKQMHFELVVGTVKCSVLSDIPSVGTLNVCLFLGLQSVGGHGLALARGCPNTGDPAHVQESAITIPPTLVHKSGERETRSESDGRKAFHRQRARHLAVSQDIVL